MSDNLLDAFDAVLEQLARTRDRLRDDERFRPQLFAFVHRSRQFIAEVEDDERRGGRKKDLPQERRQSSHSEDYAAQDEEGHEHGESEQYTDEHEQPNDDEVSAFQVKQESELDELALKRQSNEHDDDDFAVFQEEEHESNEPVPEEQRSLDEAAVQPEPAKSFSTFQREDAIESYEPDPEEQPTFAETDFRPEPVVSLQRPAAASRHETIQQNQGPTTSRVDESEKAGITVTLREIKIEDVEYPEERASTPPTESRSWSTCGSTHEHSTAASRPKRKRVVSDSNSSAKLVHPADVADDKMKTILLLCQKNEWGKVLEAVTENPYVGTGIMTMANLISTTVMHQAITSKEDTNLRSKVILEILELTPQAASIKNGLGSLPLHAIAQRNTKMDKATKEVLMGALVQVNVDALTVCGGPANRTPLHIIFTDYISPAIIKIMINLGKKACFMKDKKGWLPAHVACSRHVSLDKLRMLLDVNPSALFDTTEDGESLLDLASRTATKTHPNLALKDELKQLLERHVAHSIVSI